MNGVGRLGEMGPGRRERNSTARLLSLRFLLRSYTLIHRQFNGELHYTVSLDSQPQSNNRIPVVASTLCDEQTVTSIRRGKCTCVYKMRCSCFSHSTRAQYVALRPLLRRLSPTLCMAILKFTDTPVTGAAPLNLWLSFARGAPHFISKTAIAPSESLGGHDGSYARL
jgi:hypothetical protein